MVDIEADLAELIELLSQATRPTVQEHLKGRIHELRRELANTGIGSMSMEPGSSGRVPLDKYSWDQTDQFVK